MRENKPYVITLIPALFMTTVCTTFLMVSNTAFGLPYSVGYAVGGMALCIAIVWFAVWKRNVSKKHI